MGEIIDLSKKAADLDEGVNPMIAKLARTITMSQGSMIIQTRKGEMSVAAYEFGAKVDMSHLAEYAAKYWHRNVHAACMCVLAMAHPTPDMIEACREPWRIGTLYTEDFKRGWKAIFDHLERQMYVK